MSWYDWHGITHHPPVVVPINPQTPPIPGLSNVVITTSVTTSSSTAVGMTPSAACIALIQKEEDCILKAYQDVDGVYVVGYGCKFIDGKAVQRGQMITADDADRACRQHAQQYADAIIPLVKRTLKQGELDGLIDFVYNAGIGALAGSSLLRAINNPQQNVTEDLFTRWNKAHIKGVLTVLPNLTLRRKAEYQLFIS